MMADVGVMIVEDQAIVARDMEKTLKRLGYDIPAIVTTGEEAVQQAAETRPSLVLMDIKIQGEMDGVEAANLIRARFGIPVIYLTAYSNDEILQRAKVTEPFGYILKPFEAKEIHSAIEIALYRHEMEQQLKQSEKQYRQLFEQMHTVLQHIPVMVDAFDAEGNIIFWNQECERVTGYSAAEIVGNPKAMEQLYPDPEYRELMLTELAGRGLDYRDWEWEITCKDGSVKTVTFFNVSEHIPIADWDSWAAGVDVTGRKQAEKALRRLSSRYEAILDAVPDIIMEVDNAKVYTWANQAGLEFFGDDVLGKEAAFYFVGEQPVYDKVQPLFNGADDVIYVESWQRRKDGEERLLAWWCRTLKDESGSVAGALSTARDITERKRADEERERLLAQIQEQVQRIQQIMDTVPEGLLLLNTDGQVILANPVAERDLVVLANAKVGDILTHLGDSPLVDLLTSPPQGLWHDITADDRCFQLIARPLEAGPESQGWVLVIHDATRERETEQRVQQQERLASVGQMAAGIAHDFNNIMAVIILYARMLLRAPDLPAKACERLEIVDQQARQASELIGQILDFSRSRVLERSPMDLLLLVKEQVKLLERTLPEHIEIDLSYASDDYTVNGDPTRVQQALMNLAVNARDAMPKGGRLHIGLERISVKGRHSAPLPEMEPGEWVQVTVADSGMGIPSDKLPYIFDPFFTTKAPGQGTGLGLSQVYGIVQSHDGHIDVTSTVGEGTTFALYLPALPVQQPAMQIAAKEDLALGCGETILLVEDNDATRKALAEGLEMLNYRVLEATSGREALTVFEQHSHQIALVLSDVVMPEMGGQALFRALLQRDATVKVVLLSGHPLERELKYLQTQGLSGWLLKPPRLERLAEVLAQALEKRK